MRRSILLSSLAFGFFFQSLPAFSGSAYPKRQLSIKMTGMVAKPNQVLDLAFAEKQFKVSVITSVSPTEAGVHKFEGVSFSDLAKFFGQGDFVALKLKAVDGYIQTWTMEEIKQYEPLLAYKDNGQFMEVKDKGTFRLVMDYGNASVDKMKYTPKWVWQINEIEFVK